MISLWHGKGQATIQSRSQVKTSGSGKTGLRYHHYAYRTEQTYCDWTVRYVKFHGAKKHPREMGKAEIEALLSHPATHGRVSARSLSNITFTPRMRYILLAILSTGIISVIIVLSFFSIDNTSNLPLILLLGTDQAVFLSTFKDIILKTDDLCG
ncbi:MAG: phage integrase N-terminal SAM-like domain-containing protein [Desulfobacterales bacterium]|nr:phage integrase N-terminal SAM-like domain-containing protein [Desulfobacterales bacterium]